MGHYSAMMEVLPAPPGVNLPAEAYDSPSLFFLRKLERTHQLDRSQLAYLKAILAGLKVTEAPAQVRVLEQRLLQIPVRPE